MTRLIPRLLIIAGLGMWLISATPAGAQDQNEDKAAGEQPAVETDKKSADSPGPKQPKQPKGKGIRTLDEITIEGEIEVPQVLFITARDRARYRDHLHRLYLRNSLDLVRETEFPTRLGTWLLPE